MDDEKHQPGTIAIASSSGVSRGPSSPSSESSGGTWPQAIVSAACAVGITVGLALGRIPWQYATGALVLIAVPTSRKDLARLMGGGK